MSIQQLSIPWQRIVHQRHAAHSRELVEELLDALSRRRAVRNRWIRSIVVRRMRGLNAHGSKRIE
jgi:hypothetical protein